MDEYSNPQFPVDQMDSMETSVYRNLLVAVWRKGDAAGDEHFWSANLAMFVGAMLMSNYFNTLNSVSVTDTPVLIKPGEPVPTGTLPKISIKDQQDPNAVKKMIEDAAPQGTKALQQQFMDEAYKKSEEVQQSMASYLADIQWNEDKLDPKQARQETHKLTEFAVLGQYEGLRYISATIQKAQFKTWHTRRDIHVRPAHRILDGVTIPLKDTFATGLRYPHDPEAPRTTTEGCRCWLTYSREDVVNDKSAN